MQYLPVKHTNNSMVQHQEFSYIMVPEIESQQEGNLKDYINAIKSRKLLVIMPSIVAFPLIALYIVFQDPIYEATATVHIEKENPNIISIDEVLHADPSIDFYTTQQEIIKSRGVVSKVVDDLQLHKQEVRGKSYIIDKIGEVKKLIKDTLKSMVLVLRGGAQTELADETIDPAIAEEQRRQKTVMDLQSSIMVEPRKGTQLVDIKLRNNDPESAVKQVNMIAETYIKQNLENKLDASRKAMSWLKKRAEDLGAQIDNTENNIQNYKTKKQMIALDQLSDTHNIVLKEINSLQESYIDINAQKNNLKSGIDELSKISRKDIDVALVSSSELLKNSAIDTLRNEYNALNIQYLNLSKQYRSKHPKLVILHSQMQNLKQSIYSKIQGLINSMKRDYKVLLEEERNNERLLKSRTADFIKMSDSVVEYNKLNHNLDIDKELYRTVSKRLAETTLIEALETNNIKVIELAEVGLPASFGKAKGLAIALLTTLGVGVALAICRSKFESRFKSVAEAERYLGLDFLGSIPADKKIARRNPLSLYGTCTPISDSFRTLQTCMPVAFTEAGNTLLVTSALPGAGKSHTAANLAITFAQLGKNVILIDADLRRPKLHQILNIRVEHGLSDILKYEFEWQSVIRPTKIDNLRVIVAGRKPHNPVSLLSSETFEKLMASLKRSCDVIVIDAPITLNIPDVAIISRQADGVLLVHNPNKEDKEVVLEAKRLLNRAGANILGLIFNNVSCQQQGQYSGYQDYYR